MFWMISGIVLLIWVVYDLFTGEVWSYRLIERRSEPFQYWFWTTLWFVIAITCLLGPISWWGIW